MRGHKIQLVARNEGLRYEDEIGVLRFEVSKQGRTWFVLVPPTKEPHLALENLSVAERERIYPRISSFLARIWWLGVWPRKYDVEFRAKDQHA